MKRFIWQTYIGNVFLIFFLMATTAMGTPNTPASDANDSLESKLLDQQKKIHRLKKGIAGQKSRVRITREKEISLLTELENIERRLLNDRNKLVELKQNLIDQEKLIQQKQLEKDQVLKEKEATKSHVEKRLNAYYRMGPIGVINVIFSTATLPDLLNFREYFQHLLQYDQQVIENYRAKINNLIQAQMTLHKEKKRLVSVISDIKNQEKLLVATRKDRVALLDRVNTEKKLYQRALQEIEEAAEQLTGTLEKLKKQTTKSKKITKKRLQSPKKRRPKGHSDFASHKGRLDPPVPGTVTTYFGRNTKGKFGITTYAQGIDIKTTPEINIKAIYDGKIVYAGMLRGYGNLIIIDHGEQYYSLISRAGELYKKEGDSVNTGEIIGIMSDQSGLISEGLHFEIRHGTEPENPLHWINNAKLKIKTARKRKPKK